MRVAVCFACDEAYIPLCKGLVLSLREVLRFAPPAMTFALHFIDIGCAAASLRWLEDQGVTLNTFTRGEYPALAGQAHAPRYADAQFCRPFLPRIIPGYDGYIWADSDIWFQSSDALPAIVRAVAGFPDKAILCPEYHYGYLGHRNPRLAVATHYRWYLSLYRDEALAEELGYEPVLNTGLFAMTAANPLWKAWAEELRRLYSSDHSADPSVLHYAEQLGFNRLLYAGKAFLPLDPVFNYACGGSVVFRNPQGKVVIGYPPGAPVKGVHLLAFPLYGASYLAKGLLYRKGAYLTEEEHAALRNLLKR